MKSTQSALTNHHVSEAHDNSGLDFSTVLANSVHDMKNSIGMLLCTLDEITGQCAPSDCPSTDRFAQLQYEGQRVSYNLIQLLSIYKIEHDQYAANIDEIYLDEFLQESAMQFESLLSPRGISIDYDCDEALTGFFDREMISGVVNNVINNAYRYSKDRIRLHARQEDEYLVISVEDNGRGYPESMMINGGAGQTSVNFQTGSTGLGLYFSSLVAGVHKNKEKMGFIVCNNEGLDHGGCFSIYLP